LGGARGGKRGEERAGWGWSPPRLRPRIGRHVALPCGATREVRMRLPRLAVLFASTTLLVSPSFADSTSLPLVARLLGGLTDGGTMIQGSLGKGSVKATGDGA